MNFLDNVGQIHTSQLAVGTTAKPLASDTVLERSLCGRHTVEVVNTGSVDVFIGNKNVTAANGLPIKAGESKIIPVNYTATDNIYIVAASSTSVIIGEYFN